MAMSTTYHCVCFVKGPRLPRKCLEEIQWGTIGLSSFFKSVSQSESLLSLLDANVDNSITT